MLQKILRRAASHSIFAVGGVVAQLIDYSVGLIGNTLTVAIDIYTKGRGRLNGISAQIPHSIQRCIITYEVCCLHVEGIDCSMAHHILGCDLALVLFNLTIAHRGNLIQIVGHQHRLRACIAFIFFGNYVICVATAAKRQRITIVAHRAVGLIVYSAILGILANGNIYRLTLHITCERKFQRRKRSSAKIYESGTLIRTSHLHGQITLTHLRTIGHCIGLQLFSRAEHLHG